MVLKSPVKISTAVLGHKEKSLSVIGFLAGRIQKLFISFSKRKKKKKDLYGTLYLFIFKDFYLLVWTILKSSLNSLQYFVCCLLLWIFSTEACGISAP